MSSFIRLHTASLALAFAVCYVQAAEVESSLTSAPTGASLEAKVTSGEAVSSIKPIVILRSDPADKATSVGLDARIQLQLSPEFESLVNDKQFTLMGPVGLVPVTVARKGSVITLTPRSQFLPASKYTVFIDREQYAPLALSFTTKGLLPRTLAAVADVDTEGELWTPGPANVPGNINRDGWWRSGRAVLARASLPTSDDTRRVLYGDKTSAPLLPGNVRQFTVSKELLAKRVVITAITGQVLKLNGKPLRNVSIQLGAKSVRTNENGEFFLPDATAGRQILVLDGQTADSERKHYGRYEYRIDVEAGKINTLPFIVWMSRLDSAHATSIASPTTAETRVTNPLIPGLELRIPAGTIIKDALGRAVTEITMTAIPVDQPPFPLPNLPVPVYFTVQPGGAQLQNLSLHVPAGAQLIYPNFNHLATGTRVDFWNYDPSDKGWYVYGRGTVSEDAKQVIPDPDVVVYEFTGAMIASPSTAPADGPPPGGCKRADPVDCFSGLFVHERVDLSVADVIAIEVRRTYRPRDATSRAFGIGTNLSYDLWLIGDIFPYTYQDLVLPDGGRVRYTRISAGTGYSDAVYQSNVTPTDFYGSILQFDSASSDWLLTKRDGTSYHFPIATGATDARLGAALSMSDRVGNKLTFARDAYSNLVRVISPNGRGITLTYDASKRVIQAKDDIGRIINYAYDTSGRLASATDPENKVEQYTYDASNRMLTVIDKRNNVMVTNEYDANGRVTKQTYPDSSTYLFAYTLDANGKVIQTDSTDERGSVTRMSFNASGYITSVIMALGKPEEQTSAFARDATTNLLLSSTDALTRVTTYAYDYLGNLTQMTRLATTPDAVTITSNYSASFSRPLVMTDSNNHTTTVGYDPSGNRISVTDALGHSVLWTYDNQGRPLTAADALGHLWTLQYSGADLSASMDPLNRQISWFADGVGRVRVTKDPLGNRTQFQYDKLDRTLSWADPNSANVQFAYDPNGNLSSLTDSRTNATVFTYDLRNRVSTEKDALLQTESNAYEAGGLIRQKTDRKGQVTTVTYDGLGRPVSIGYGATIGNPALPSSTTTLTWDKGDRLTKSVDSVSGNITRTYDGLDRLLTEVTPQGAVSYTYDAGGRRSTMTVTGQPTVTYTWDAADRLIQVSQAAGASNNGVVQNVIFAYDNANRRTLTTLANGGTIAYGYDNANQLLSLVYKKSDGSAIGDLNYSYDLAGRRIQNTGSMAQTDLPSVSMNDAQYDANNRLTRWLGQTLGYDANGNLTGDGLRTYTWNPRDQLEALSGNVTATFQYDGWGRRIGKTVGGNTTAYFYDVLDFVQEKDSTEANANVTANILVAGLDRPVARMTGTGAGTRIESFLVDGNNNVIQLRDQTQGATTQYSYEAYGKTTIVNLTGTSGNTQQFSGREADATGLTFYRARYYRADVARFVSTDPIRFHGGANLYSYTNGDPLSYIDPYGLWRFPDYYSISVQAFGPLGASFTIDRSGAAYFGLGLGFGGLRGGLGAGVGWTGDKCEPNSKQLANFISGWGVNAGFGFGSTVSSPQDPGSESSDRAGPNLQTPGASVGYNWRLFNIPAIFR